MTSCVGILVYGSLLEDPGSELEAVRTRTITGMTRFGVAFARLSASRDGAPILTRVSGRRAVRVKAGILCLESDVTPDEARDMLFCRDTHSRSALSRHELMTVGWIKVAGVGDTRVDPHGKKACPLDDLFAFDRDEQLGEITTVLYVDRPPIRGWRWWLTPGELAKRAISSARGPAGDGAEHDRRDGITYLQQIIAAQPPPGLTERYEKAILRRLGADDLTEAWTLARAQVGDAGPVGAPAPPAPAGAPADAGDAGALGNDPLRDAILKVAGAIGTGIGVVGLVTLIGGAYFWLRFSSVGLPADEAVGDLTHSQLLVVGIQKLYPFVGLSIVGVLVLYGLEQFALFCTRHVPRGWLPADNGRRRTAWVLAARALGAISAVVVAVVFDAIRFHDTSSSFWYVLLAAGVLAGAVMLYAFISHPSFIRFMLAALAATAVFALFSAAFRESEVPAVRPVVLIDNGKPLGGIYITATSDEVYVGEVCESGNPELGDSNTGSQLAIPRAGVSLILIGDNAGLDATIVREGTILYHLPDQTPISSAAIKRVRPKPNSAGRLCTDPEAAVLAP